MDRLVDHMGRRWIDVPAADTVKAHKRADGASTAWSATAGRFTSDPVIADETTITAAAITAQSEPARQRAITTEDLAGELMARAQADGMGLGRAACWPI